MIRTSLSDPIQIAELSCGGGVIGVTFCPGKKGESAFGEPWNRDLQIDVAAMRAWGASTVLTLIEDHEFDMLDVRGLAAACRAHGMTWLHAPITDVGVPGASFEALWAVVGHKARHELRCGNRVVVHCRGGRGRAGLVAARLLAEFGENPDRAIAAVRAARPGAIETTAQAGHVQSVHTRIAELERDDRVLGCLFGGAVGDGFGYAVEFDSLSEIHQLHGPGGLVAPSLVDGRFVVSDDTQMTLFTAEAIDKANGPESFADECRQAYLRWHETQSGSRPASGAQGLLAHAALWRQRAPGNTCMSALATGGLGTTDNRINDSKGCGGVMRVAPIGLVERWDERTAFDLGAASAAITHGHPSGYFSAAAMAAIVRNLMNGLKLTAAIERVTVLLEEHEEAAETRVAIEQAVALGRASKDGSEIARGMLGQGWVGEEALAIAIYSCLVGSDFEETMRIAANHDGDSDSTASIAGQLFGAQWGLDRIPWDWIEPLDVFDAVCDVAASLTAIHRSDATSALRVD